MSPTPPSFQSFTPKEQESAADLLLDRAHRNLRLAREYADVDWFPARDLAARKRLCKVNLRRAALFHASACRLGWQWADATVARWQELTAWAADAEAPPITFPSGSDT